MAIVLVLYTSGCEFEPHLRHNSKDAIQTYHSVLNIFSVSSTKITVTVTAIGTLTCQYEFLMLQTILI